MTDLRKGEFESRGCGMGLRSQHYPVITESWPRLDWFEAISENYMDTGGRPLHVLEKVRRHYPVALHGTALSIGSTDPLNHRYLERLKTLADRIDPFIVSDHLCWSGTEGEQLHDLLPLPLTEEALRHVVSRVHKVQETLGRPILLENVSTYVTFRHSTMTEWDFLTEVSKRSGCGILLDVNNLYVNSVNHRFDPMEFLKAIPGAQVGQIHLAGHTDRGDFLFDTHSRPIIDRVWSLYDEAMKRFGQVSTLVEWDENIPSFEELNAEVERAKTIYQKYQGRSCPPAACLPPAPAYRQAGARPGRARPGWAGREKIEIPLEEVQSLLRQQIRHRKVGQNIKNLLNPQAGTPGVERLEVYADGFPARIRESLAEVYEAVHAAVGDERFDELALAYAAGHASQDYNLNHAGLGFQKFLKTAALSKETLFLPDLAAFEWAIWEVFHAIPGEGSVSRKDPSKVSAEDWERSVILFRKPVSLFDSPWPVLDLWKTRRDLSAAAGVCLENNPQSVLITRKEDQVRCEILSPDQRRLVAGLLSGRTLGDVCEELAEVSESPACQSGREDLPVSAWFSVWMRDGLIVGCLASEQASVV